MNLADARQKAQEARERAKKATEGPWEAVGPTTRKHVVRPAHSNHGFTAVAFSQDDDADFVAHARTDVPELASLVEALAEEVERLRWKLALTEEQDAAAFRDQEQEITRLSARVDELTTAKDMGWARVERAEEQLGRYVGIEHDLSRRIEALEEALRFYADRGNAEYGPDDFERFPKTPPDERHSFLVLDDGKRARDALSGGDGA